MLVRFVFLPASTGMRNIIASTVIIRYTISSSAGALNPSGSVINAGSSLPPRADSGITVLANMALIMAGIYQISIMSPTAISCP